MPQGNVFSKGQVSCEPNSNCKTCGLEIILLVGLSLEKQKGWWRLKLRKAWRGSEGRRETSLILTLSHRRKHTTCQMAKPCRFFTNGMHDCKGRFREWKNDEGLVYSRATIVGCATTDNRNIHGTLQHFDSSPASTPFITWRRKNWLLPQI
jgi:hypothetical protein